MKIGLMLPLGEDDVLGRPVGWEQLREMAVAADEGGLDSVWGADHLIFRSQGESHGIHECWTILTAVAAVTTRVEIGVGRALAEYGAHAMDHLIVHLWPRTAAAVTELARAAEIARADARIGAHG